MRGKRAKLLRKWANYDMKNERYWERKYKLRGGAIYCINERALYKQLKKRVYVNRRRKGNTVT